jgi:hypothetical protein
MFLYTHMYFAGLLFALLLDAMLFKIKQYNKSTILFLLAIVLFLISILIGNTIGNSIGFFSLGIYTTTLLVALLSIHSSWKKYAYYFVILIVMIYSLFFFTYNAE